MNYFFFNKMVSASIIVFSILFIIIIIWLIIISVLNTSVKDNINEAISDSLYHLSTETLNGVEYAGTLANKNIDLINLNGVYGTDTEQANKSYLNGTAKTFSSGEWYSQGIAKLYNASPISTYGGIYDKDNICLYNTIKFEPLEPVVKIKGTKGCWAYIKKLKRNIDNVIFYYIQLGQSFDAINGYNAEKSYQNIYELYSYIQKNYPNDLLLIIGDFSIHGHQKLAEMIFGNKDYHIGDMVNYITCNDNEGLASPDGFIISKKLYPRIEWTVESVPSTSWQHLALRFNLYRYGIPGVYFTNKMTMLPYYETLTKFWDNHNAKLNYYKKEIILPGEDIMKTWSSDNVKVDLLEKAKVFNTLSSSAVTYN